MKNQTVSSKVIVYLVKVEKQVVEAAAKREGRSASNWARRVLVDALGPRGQELIRSGGRPAVARTRAYKDALAPFGKAAKVEAPDLPVRDAGARSQSLAARVESEVLPEVPAPRPAPRCPAHNRIIPCPRCS